MFYKGDMLPAQGRNTFSTASDNQSQVEVHLVLGENKLASDNVSLGKFILDGIPPAPKGIPQIQVVCEINQELELYVTATDKTSGQKKNFQVVKLATISPPPIKDPLPPKPNTEAENLFGSSTDFTDWFRTIFGKQNAEGLAPEYAKEYQQSLEISMEEAYKGTARPINTAGVQKLVRIPAGVRTGSKVRVAGAGPNGLDLYLIISVQPHPFFMRTGLDLSYR
jgi:hypothetical protein